ncbi:MAG: hypothetical protein IT204_20725 [Fimbriimonadaceae bacterium]|nr:hypothetical protein [Fimbriimonadaceae bacterium]
MRHRLHSLCPYFAMFPEGFVEEQVCRWTEPGDWVLDPFSGRGTTLLQSLLMGRRAAAADISPLAYCLTAAKAETPALEGVLSELEALEELWRSSETGCRAVLPEFFRHAFHAATLDQILFLRDRLNWRHSPVQRFIAALCLGSLHGETRSPNYFSNQMPRTIATKPDYSVRYWAAHGQTAPERDVFTVLRSRARLRLSSGASPAGGRAACRDARSVAGRWPDLVGRVRLVVTSPPYLDVTRYEEDQWLRLWFLGHEPRPTYSQISPDDRHTSPDHYWAFLRDAWRGLASLLGEDAVLVCRLGATGCEPDELAADLTASIADTLPGFGLAGAPRVSRIRGRQTRSFRPGSRGCLYELDATYRRCSGI